MDKHDRSGLLQTIETHEKNLLRYAVSLLGDLDRARDVVQETFFRWIRRSDRQQLEFPWLVTVCRNLVIDQQRKESRMETLVDENPLPYCHRPQEDPLKDLETRDLIRRVMQSAASLPDRQKEILRLKFQSGLSYREIAEVTSLSVSNVGYLIHTAIQTLREEFRDELQATSVRGGAQ